MKPDDLRELGNLLRRGDQQQRCAAAEALSRAEVELPVETISALLEATEDSSEPVVEWSTAALEQLQPVDHGGELIAELLHRLPGPGQAAYWSCTLLGRVAHESATKQQVVSGLLATVARASADMAVRERAAWALGEIGRPDTKRDQWEAVLREAAGSSNPRLARLARAALE